MAYSTYVVYPFLGKDYSVKDYSSLPPAVRLSCFNYIKAQDKDDIDINVDPVSPGELRVTNLKCLSTCGGSKMLSGLDLFMLSLHKTLYWFKRKSTGNEINPNIPNSGFNIAVSNPNDYELGIMDYCGKMREQNPPCNNLDKPLCGLSSKDYSLRLMFSVYVCLADKLIIGGLQGDSNVTVIFPVPYYLLREIEEYMQKFMNYYANHYVFEASNNTSKTQARIDKDLKKVGVCFYPIADKPDVEFVSTGESKTKLRRIVGHRTSFEQS